MNGPEREWRRRAWRIAGLLLGIMLVLAGASALVERGGARELARRAEQELAHRIETCRSTVEARLAEAVRALEVLARQEQMLRIWDRDADSEIQVALEATLERSSLFHALRCVDASGVVIASTVPREFETEVLLSEPVLELAAIRGAARRGHLALQGERIALAVPVIWRAGDEPEHLGYLLAELEPARLLSPGGAAIARLLAADGTLLCEQRADQALAPGSGPAWENPELSIRTATVALPGGTSGPEWTAAIADHDPTLAAEASVLRRMVLLLTGGTVGLLVVLVLVFARFEAGLFRRLADRARELESLNARLDKSRADLVKAARLAGMSEVATGILHNVGNALNSLGVSAQEAERALSRGNLSKLRRLVGLFEGEGQGLASALRAHPKGEPFLEYLPAVAGALEADHAKSLGELAAVRASIERIAALVKSQQELTGHSSFREPARLSELLEGALVISKQVLGEAPGLCVETSVAADREVLLHKHKVIEILVTLINNARQSVEAARASPPRLELAVEELPGDRVRFSVVDNGQGIPAENLERIFQQGFSTKGLSRGYGLHAAANSATELAGSLVARSAGPGCGATFMLELPVARPAAA